MKPNIGLPDRLLRLLIAVILFALAWMFIPEITGYIFLIFGLFTTYEALASWCIMYQLLGINTCPIDKR